jgi:hypothetical protein
VLFTRTVTVEFLLGCKPEKDETIELVQQGQFVKLAESSDLLWAGPG